MKKIIIALLFGVLISSCSKTEKEETTSQMLQEPEQTTETATSTEEIHEGLALIKQTTCLTCHKEDARMVGPSYREVAAKYTEADIDQLADNIINGSVGKWGTVPMTPHPGMSKENAKKMVEYILTLK